MRIDDLRSTLAEHADLTHDEGLSDRAGAVRGRVRTVRRRRAAVAVACVAGAVLAVPALQALEVTPPEPASDRDLAGRTAPETLVSNGFTFEFDRGVEGSAGVPLDLRLDRSKEPRLISWTVDDGDAEGRLADRLYGDTYASPWTAGGTGFETFEYVAPGARASYRLTSTGDDGADSGSEGQMAMAVYTLSDDVPAGFSANGVTFRDDVDGAELLGAAIGQPGEASLSFDIEVPEGMLRLSEVCTAGRDYMVRTEVEGQRGYTGTACGLEPDRDPATSWTGYVLAGTRKADGTRFRAGETVEVTVSVHPNERGQVEPVEVPGAFVGLGAYADDPGEPVGPTGTTVDRLVERSGHTWSLTDLDVSEPGADSHVVEVGPVPARTYVDFGAANDPRGQDFGRDLRWSTRIDGDPLGRSYYGRNGSSGPSVDIRLDKGESMTIDLRAISGVDEFLSFYVATYTVAD
jgi:hypothetical protein